LRILLIGDVMGRAGRRAVRALLPGLRRELRLDLVVANGENAAGGVGLTVVVMSELLDMGIDLLTSGNHIWDKREVLLLFQKGGDERLIRPANYPPGTPGRGSTVLEARNGTPVGVINVSGRVFLNEHLDCPFRTVDAELAELHGRCRVVIVDLHAEATSEKMAFGFYVDGRVTAVLGTHTHVQTNDARLLPRGTAYMTDVGMTGPRDSVIGVKPEMALQRFLTQMPARFEVARGPLQLCGAVLIVDPDSGRAREVLPINRVLDDGDHESG